MNAETIRLGDIDDAIHAARSMVSRMSYNARGYEERDLASGYQASISRGEAALRQLYEVWSEFKNYQSQRSRSYDAYVTSPRDDYGNRCCSCHISAPCGFCVSQPEDEE